MGCKQGKLHEERQQASGSSSKRRCKNTALTASGVPLLPKPADDVITDVCDFSDTCFATAGVEGWVHVYDADLPDLVGKLHAHQKAVNRLKPWHDRLLTASGDATVCVWSKSAVEEDGQSEPEAPLLAIRGHEMSVRALDVLGAASPSSGSTSIPSGADASPLLITGSRDCTVRIWDLATGAAVHKTKILRNVVTSIRSVPGEPHLAVQASEDLTLRLWDVRAIAKPAAEVRSGPNQIICLDVTDDGRHVVGGTKGFSRENCEVHAFDLRSSLRQAGAVACADQTIEVLRVVGPDRCIAASRDGHLRSLALSPELAVVAEHGPNSTGGYTAVGAIRRPGTGPVVLAAVAGQDGPELELLEYRDAALAGPPKLLAATG